MEKMCIRDSVSTVDITGYLEEKGFQIDRKTLHSDLRLLISMGYDIVVVKSSPNKYFWGERTFEIPELKMLLDAVSSARFISCLLYTSRIQKPLR